MVKNIDDQKDNQNIEKNNNLKNRKKENKKNFDMISKVKKEADHENKKDIDITYIKKRIKELYKQKKNADNSSNNKIKKQNENIKKIDEEIWNLIKLKTVLETKEKIEKKELITIKGLIITVGFSKEPIILSIISFEPEYVVFIHSNETEKIIDIIVEETNLKTSQFRKIPLKKNDAATAYNTVKEAYRTLLYEKNFNQEKIALDPTGGTKIMSVGCGIYTTTANVNIIYVSNKKYDPDNRRPVPGTEEIIMIKNPLLIYYDQILFRGIALLKNGDYSGALNFFEDAYRNARENRKPEILKTFAIALKAWDALEYETALKKLKELDEIIEKFEILKPLKEFTSPSITFINKIVNAQKKEENRQNYPTELIYDLYMNANRKKEKKEFDNACLRYYRVLEMINQKILWRSYEINTSNPNIPQDLTNKVEEKLKQLIEIVYSQEELKIFKENYKNKKIKELIALFITIFFIYKNNENGTKLLGYIKEKENNKNLTIKDFAKNNNINLETIKTIKENINEAINNGRSFYFSHQIAFFNGLIIRYLLDLINTDLKEILIISSIIDKRNKSILAHGISPINEKITKNFKKLCNGFLFDLVEYNENNKFQEFKKRNDIPEKLTQYNYQFSLKKNLKTILEKIEKEI